MDFAVDAILFDCDGVLVDSLETAAHAWDAWARDFAPDFDFRSQMTHGARSSDVIATLVEPERHAEAVAALDAAEVALAHETSPVPGAVELSERIPEGRWAVVTSGIREVARTRLRAAGFTLPEHIITAEDVTRGKPDAEPYARGAAALGVPAHRCAVLEDAAAGVKAARAAGVQVIIGVGDHLDGAFVDAHVEDLRDVSFGERGLSVKSPYAASTSAETR